MNDPAAPLPPENRTRPRVNWLVFFAALLSPALVTLLGAMAGIDGLAVASPMVGGGIAGLICGIMLARCVGRTTGTQIALGFLFVLLFGFVSFALGFFGCIMGGFKLDMR